MPQGDSEREETDRAQEVKEERDVLIARALEVLKSWAYFDRLSEGRAQPAPPAPPSVPSSFPGFE